MRRDHVAYDLWQRQGHLQTTEGNVVHYSFIEKYIEGLGERFNIREIAFDRWERCPFRENIKADKAKSTEKIDGAIALIMTLDRAIRCGNVNGESVYENRGLLVF